MVCSPKFSTQEKKKKFLMKRLAGEFKTPSAVVSNLLCCPSASHEGFVLTCLNSNCSLFTRQFPVDVLVKKHRN